MQEMEDNSSYINLMRDDNHKANLKIDFKNYLACNKREKMMAYINSEFAQGHKLMRRAKSKAQALEEIKQKEQNELNRTLGSLSSATKSPVAFGNKKSFDKFNGDPSSNTA